MMLELFSSLAALLSFNYFDTINMAFNYYRHGQLCQIEQKTLHSRKKCLLTLILYIIRFKQIHTREFIPLHL